MNKLPEKLTVLRKHYQYSQGDVAQKLNIPVTEYMKWENGNDICSIRQLKQLADLYHVSLDVLADNARDLQFTDNTQDDSVSIPFMNGNDINMTQEIDPADNMMPVDGVLPPYSGDGNTIQVNTNQPEQGDSGATRVMDTRTFEQEEEPEEAEEEPYQEPEPSRRRPSGSTPKKKKNNRKKQSLLIVGIVCAAVVIVLGILLAASGFSLGGSGLKAGEDNRLAVGDTYTLYIDSSGTLKTYGSFNTSSSFNGAVQVSAYDQHAAALLNTGKAVSSDGNQTVSGWEDLKYIAAGRDHTAAVKNDGKVVCTGNQNACQVGDWKNIEKVYAGDGFTLGLDSDGAVKVSGSKANAVRGQTGVSDIAISDNLVLLAKKNGKVSSYLLGAGEPAAVDDWTDIEKVAAGTNMAAGLKKDGSVEIDYSDTDVTDKVEDWKNIRYLAANGSTIVAIDRSGNMHGAGDNSSNQYENTGSKSGSKASSSPSASADSTLDKPSGITASATTANVVIKWNTVRNAGSYIVSISDVGDLPATTTNQASVAATSLESGTTYTITVTAVPKNKDKYKESSASVSYTYEPKTVKLDTPGSITSKAENGGWTISWSSVDHADSYGVSINGAAEQKVSTNSMSINDIDAGTYTFSIRAYSANSTYTQSDAGSATVNLQYADQAYTVQFVNGGNVVYTADNVKLTPGKSYTASDISQASGGSDSMIQNHTITAGQDAIIPDPNSTLITVEVDN